MVYQFDFVHEFLLSGVTRILGEHFDGDVAVFEPRRYVNLISVVVVNAGWFPTNFSFIYLPIGPASQPLPAHPQLVFAYFPMVEPKR